jgi:hypothetical protein
VVPAVSLSAFILREAYPSLTLASADCSHR